MTDHSAHAEASDAHGGAGHGSHSGIGKYVAVFFALCFLTGLSFWTYADFPFPWPFHHQPAVGRAFMMAVSCTKAMLVILFFMHVKYEANWKYVLTIPAAMMSVFLMLMLIPDVGMRNRNHDGGPMGVSQQQWQRLGNPKLESVINAARERTGE